MEQNPQAQKMIKDIKNVLFQDDDGSITHVDTTYSNLIESLEKLAKVSYDMGYAEAFDEYVRGRGF